MEMVGCTVDFPHSPARISEHQGCAFSCCSLGPAQSTLQTTWILVLGLMPWQAGFWFVVNFVFRQFFKVCCWEPYQCKSLIRISLLLCVPFFECMWTVIAVSDFSFYNVEEVLWATAATTLVTLALTIFALQTKVRILGTDFCHKGVCLECSLVPPAHFCTWPLCSEVLWVSLPWPLAFGLGPVDPQLEMGSREERGTYSHGNLWSSFLLE